MKVFIYTDGSCKGNPGPGGWAALLAYGKHQKVIKGGSSHTTNNRMELMAVIKGLSALRRPADVVLVTDSHYVAKLLNGGNAGANLDLVGEMRAAASRHRLEVQTVKGHSGHPKNELVDQLASEQAELRKA